MLKDLVIGDIHATADELDDVGHLMLLVDEIAQTYQAHRLIFLGDLHHTFAVTNVKVTAFYRSRFKLLASKYGAANVIAIPGNHDMPGNGAQYPHALIAYEDLITVVDKPTLLSGSLFLPYYADPNLFHKDVDANLRNVMWIYCHQEFNGAQYDNGFFAPHGADPAKMTVPVISGHIHTPQKLGKVWYPGAPRWRTLSDANVKRAIYLVSDGEVEKALPLFTGERVKRIWSIRCIEGQGQDIFPEHYEKDSYRIYIEGSPSYVKTNADCLKEMHPNARITVNIKNKTIRVRESDGIEVAFQKYASSFKGKHATSSETLWEKARSRIYG